MDEGSPPASNATRQRTVLVVAYEFSTRIIGGSIRAIKFTQELSQFGWYPIVLTATPPGEHPVLDGGEIQYVPSADKAFSGGIRVGNDSSGLLQTSSKFLNLLRPLKSIAPLERQVLWWSSVKRHARSLSGSPVIDAVLVTAAPYSTLPIGRWLSRKHDVPLLIDLRDDWQDRFRIEKRSRLNRFLLEKWAMSVVKSASATVVVSDLTRKRFADRGIDVAVIQNGYDENDFVDIGWESSPAASDGPLTIVHTGWLGSFRSVSTVLDAMRIVATEERSDLQPSISSPVFRLEQVGLVDEQQLALLTAFREECDAHDGFASGAIEVIVRGQRPHAETLKHMQKADVLLAIPGTEIPSALSGKFYEYLRSRRPILLCATSGAATSLAASVGVRHVVEPGNVNAVADELRDLLEKKRGGMLSAASNPGLVRKFSRQEAGRKLAGLLDSVVKTAGSKI